MTTILKRYSIALVFISLNVLLALFVPDKGLHSFEIEIHAVMDLITFIPPIFILLGLLDVWVAREKLMPYMGPESGVKGGLLAFAMGSAAAGPLYIAFPIAGVLLKKGAALVNIFIFIGAWSTTKLPMILFEASSFGLKYTLFRLVVNTIGIIVIAVLLDKTTSQSEKKRLYQIGRSES